MAELRSDELNELVDLRVPRVDLVDRAANRHQWLATKSEEGGESMTVDELLLDPLHPVAKSDNGAGEGAEKGTESGDDAPAEKASQHVAAIKEALDKLAQQAGSLPESVQALIRDLATHVAQLSGEGGQTQVAASHDDAAKATEGGGEADQPAGDAAKDASGASGDDIGAALKSIQETVGRVAEQVTTAASAAEKATGDLAGKLDAMAETVKSLGDRVDALESARGVKKSVTGQDSGKGKSVWATGIL